MYNNTSNEVFTLCNYSQLKYYGSCNLNCVLERLAFDSTALIEIPVYWDLAKVGLPVLQMLSHCRTLTYHSFYPEHYYLSNPGSFSPLSINITSREIPSLTVLSSLYFAFILFMIFIKIFKYIFMCLFILLTFYLPIELYD